VLAIAGGKGGGGKTTTALGLARAIEGPTLVVDADRDMPDLHALAGVSRSPTLAAVVRGRDPIEVAQADPGRADVAILPAPTAGDGDDGLVEAALERCARTDRAVLVDCPSGAGPDAAVPLSVAGATLLVSPVCAPALQDAAKTAAMARAVGTDVIGTVLTRTRIAPDAIAELLGCPVAGRVPPVDPPVLSSRPVRRAYGRVADAVGAGSRARGDRPRRV
jgi:septum site-determining protein MinD